MAEYWDPDTGEVCDLAQPDGLARALASLGHGQTRLSQRIEVLAESLDGLQQRLDSADAGQAADATTSWTWRTMTARDAERLWRRLADWVAWLRGRYPLAEQLPACWWRHSELVEELTGLHLAWRAAYTDPTAPLTGPADWHDRYLPAAVARISGWGVHCTDTHRDRPAGIYDPRAVDDREAFAAAVTADLTTRRSVTAQGDGSAASPAPQPNGHEIEESDDAGEGVLIAVPDMIALLATGRAHRLGTAPDAPVSHAGDYWISDGGAYVRVSDPAICAQLRRDEQHLNLIDHAQDSDDQPPTGDGRGREPAP